MGLFSQNPSLKKGIQDKIVGWVKDSGVQIAMDQGSVSFENFIQIKLAGFLRNKFIKQYFIKIESHEKEYQADILIFRKNSDKARPIAAFQVKIVSLNSPRNSVKMNGKYGVLADIEKLVPLGQSCDKFLICVVYQFAPGNVKSWGHIKGVSKTGEDYRTEIINTLPGEHRNNHCVAPAVVRFGNKSGCVDIFEF